MFGLTNATAANARRAPSRGSGFIEVDDLVICAPHKKKQPLQFRSRGPIRIALVTIRPCLSTPICANVAPVKQASGGLARARQSAARHLSVTLREQNPHYYAVRVPRATREVDGQRSLSVRARSPPIIRCAVPFAAEVARAM